MLSLRSVSKSFAGVHALRDVSFDVVPGEIHALVGENGAGKSTLMRILSGVYTDYDGQITLDGESIAFSSPGDAQSHGIAIIHQELNLIAACSGPGSDVSERPITNVAHVRAENATVRSRSEVVRQDMEAYPMDWPSCRNVRDLAGIAVDGGRWIRPGALIRSDNLVLLDERGLAALRSAGVSRVVDLRSVWECRSFPSPLADDPAWVNVPLTDAADPDESALDLAVQYCNLLDRGQTRFGEAIAAIADAPPGCVVVNCHAGKDRTGLVIAIVLAVVGVSDQAISADYVTLGPGPASAMQIGSPFLEGSSVPEMMLPRPATIVKALDHLRARYGSVAAYLTRAGVTGRQLQSLTGRLCTS